MKTVHKLLGDILTLQFEKILNDVTVEQLNEIREYCHTVTQVRIEIALVEDMTLEEIFS